jgi:hypothetical protein
MKKQVANYLYDVNVLSDEYQIIYADDGQQRRRPWALPAGLEKRNGALVFSSISSAENTISQY